ncbi:uncharacterized protein LOC110271666 [Arachis ipaensis]|uniref:uncharacterized protein LOC110271666 n=1 Tax=Arachis ipaensis TaxID=130454 RepID=UPI000A2B2DD8|nr:uncharacterized protein LOC110271666 [Arachis ipaensis]
MGGETTMIEEIDGDRWSVFEAYAELRQFGYVQENIPSLWLEKPILTMLEEIRVKLMTRWAENRDLAQNYAGTILPRIRIKLERRSRSVGEWRPYWSAAQKYEVVSGLDKFTVDLGSFECSCRRWQLSGIPCVHAISCIKFKGFGLEPYVADCYKRETYLKCYEAVIYPLNRPDLWEITPHPDVMPPPYRRPSHRPVKKENNLLEMKNRAATFTCPGRGRKKSALYVVLLDIIRADALNLLRMRPKIPRI